MSVVIDGRSFRRDLEALEEGLKRTATRALTDAVDAAARDLFKTNEYKNRSWDLRTKTRATVDPVAFTGRISNPTKQAVFIEVGTKPHVIKPRRARVLRFYSARFGSWVHSKGVNHPGTKGRWIFKHAAEVGRHELERAMVALTEHHVGKFNSAA